MHWYHFCLAWFVICIPNVLGTDIIPEADINPNVQEEVVVKAMKNVALDISISLWNNYFTENVIYSPLSVGSLMSLLLLGSRGVSFLQLKKALFFDDNVTDSVIHETFQYIVGSLETGTHVHVNMSSQIFVQDGLQIEGTYKQVAQALYDANITPVNFHRNPGHALRTINDWILKSTKGKIRKIANSPFPTTTSMVAVNTIFFNGPWENPFNRRDTINGLFDTGKASINIPMMSNIQNVKCLQKHRFGFDLIALPYKGKRYSLYIMMPSGRAGIFSLVNMESRLSSIPLNSIINEMKEKDIHVTIPRIKIQFRDDMRKYFESLGATDIFDIEQANFGRMSQTAKIAVDAIIHEAVLEITETGTTAAAATAATANRLGPSKFVFNKPSLIFIRDETNGLILFWGRVIEPEAI